MEAEADDQEGMHYKYKDMLKREHHGPGLPIRQAVSDVMPLRGHRGGASLGLKAWDWRLSLSLNTRLLRPSDYGSVSTIIYPQAGLSNMCL